MLVNYRSSPIHFFTVNTAMVKRNASVARCAPNPARLSSINLDLRSVTPAAVRLRLRPEQCCHLQLLHGPITAGTIPGENTAFTTCVDPISPPRFQPPIRITVIITPSGLRLKWWRRRVPPPGPLCLFHSTFIAIAGEPAPVIYDLPAGI